MSVAAVLLAAGRALRFSGGAKLLADIDGIPLIAHMARQLAASRARPIVAVVRPDAEDIVRALDGLGVVLAVSADPEWRMGRSIGAGVAALGGDPDGAMIVPGDMPRLNAEVLDRLIAEFEREGGSRIVYPTLPDGSQRNPVVWPRRLFARLEALDTTNGGKALLEELVAEAVAVPFVDAAPFTDIDTREDLARYLASR